MDSVTGVAPPLPMADWREYGQWFMGRRRRFRVREYSMWPVLAPQDTVLASLAGVTAGDIAIARHPQQPDRLIIKRVKEVFYDGGVYLISDNVHEPSARDSRHFGVVSASQIVGRVTSCLAKGRNSV